MYFKGVCISLIIVIILTMFQPVGAYNESLDSNLPDWAKQEVQSLTSQWYSATVEDKDRIHSKANCVRSYAEKQNPMTLKGLSVAFTVRNGASGSDVRSLQQSLKDAGYTITVDGKFDNTTETILKKYQNSVSLGADGIAGLNTWAKLGEIYYGVGYITLLKQDIGDIQLLQGSLVVRTVSETEALAVAKRWREKNNISDTAYVSGGYAWAVMGLYLQGVREEDFQSYADYNKAVFGMYMQMGSKILPASDISPLDYLIILTGVLTKYSVGVKNKYVVDKECRIYEGNIKAFNEVPAGKSRIMVNRQTGEEFETFVEAKKLKGVIAKDLVAKQERYYTPDLPGKQYVKPDYSIYDIIGRLAAIGDAKTSEFIPYDLQAQGFLKAAATTTSRTLIYYTPTGKSTIAKKLLDEANEIGVRIIQIGVK